MTRCEHDNRHTFNVLDSVVWEPCAGTRSLAQILSTVFETFDVTAEEAQSGLLYISVQLQQEDLFHIERR